MAGPIVRAREFLPQLQTEPVHRVDRLRSGLLLIFVGLFKKIVVGDGLGFYLVDPAFDNPGEAGWMHLWVAIYGFTFQVYCDFSGYSDVARGTARILGFDIPDNFNRPYAAQRLADLWQRWHITLYAWLRDYLLAALGGLRGSRARSVLNLVILFTLSGLWHGAAWTFVLWGLYHGILMSLEYLLRLRRRGQSRHEPHAARRVLNVGLTFHLFAVSAILFRAHTVTDSGLIVQRLFSAAPAGENYIREHGLWLLLLAVVMHYGPRTRADRASAWILRQPAVLQGAAAACALALLSISYTGVRPFIYFQF